MKQEARNWFIPAALALVLLFGACGGGEESTSQGDGGADKAAKETEVTIEGFAFKPKTIEVSVGASVKWNQKDNTDHTVTSGEAGVVDPANNRANPAPDGKFESGNIAEGKDFTFKFDEAGTFAYYCTNHPEGMRGEVVVS